GWGAAPPQSTLFPSTTLFRSGRRVRVGDAEGTVEGVAPDGALRLRQSDGTITDVRAGHVAWTPPATPATMNGPEGLPPPRPSTTDRKSTRLNSSHVKSSYAVF